MLIAGSFSSSSVITPVIQFWEMQMSTHRVGKYGYEL